MGVRSAVSFARTQPRPEAGNVNRKQYGADRVGPDQFQNRRRIIIHGLKSENDETVMESILDIYQTMSAIIFSTDVVEIERLGKPDAKDP